MLGWRWRALRLRGVMLLRRCARVRRLPRLALRPVRRSGGRCRGEQREDCACEHCFSERTHAPTSSYYVVVSTYRFFVKSGLFRRQGQYSTCLSVEDASNARTRPHAYDRFINHHSYKICINTYKLCFWWARGVPPTSGNPDTRTSPARSAAQHRRADAAHPLARPILRRDTIHHRTP